MPAAEVAALAAAAEVTAPPKPRPMIAADEAAPPPTAPMPAAPPPPPPAAAPTGPVEPGAIAPQAARRKPTPVQKTKPTRKLRAGDLICAQCGEGNNASRKFCARCGNSLEMATTVKTPWWKKFVPHRKAKTLAVGERPGQGRNKPTRHFSLATIMRPLQGVLGIVLIVAVALFAFFPGFRNGVNDRAGSLKKKVSGIFTPQYDHVSAAAVASADSEQKPDHTAIKAFDGFKNTYWLTAQPDLQPHLRVEFSEPVNIDKVDLRNGAFDKFQQFNRAKTIKFVFAGGTDVVNVKDQVDQKAYTVTHGHNTNSAEIFITDQFSGLQGEQPLALTEMTFFKKS
jgi:hypothetical protein